MAGWELEVAEEDAGERLDVWLARRTPLSRARAKARILEGGVRVNGRPARKSQPLLPGDRVTLSEAPGPSDFDPLPDTGAPIDVRFENERFVVVEKPPGMPSHPLGPLERGTVANALVARYPEMRGVGYRAREAGLLHRLDTDTSGLILAARSPDAFRALRDALRAGAIEKRYLARCEGMVPAPCVIDTPIASDPRDRRKVRVCRSAREAERLGARPARTDVLDSTAAAGGSLVEVRANHARRHQVRAHLASIGHPLVGDTLYGGPELPGIAHHLLHASRMHVEGITVEARPWGHALPEKTS